MVASAWLLVSALLVFQMLPTLPRSLLQWCLFLGFGPPLYVLGEGFFAWLFSPAHGYAIENRPFSVLRIVVALPVMLVFMALSWWLSGLLSRA
jgi:hypothetical protein